MSYFRWLFQSQKKDFISLKPFLTGHHKVNELLRVGRGGFEPPKASPTDLQSAPFDRSGISPNVVLALVPDRTGADGRTRTADRLITNQLLYQLSYIG